MFRLVAFAVQRVVAGSLRGRKLATLPRGIEVRPSSSRVRSAIFDRLQREVGAARVLDVFAGSGALAIEALSRGAVWATLIELHPSLSRFVTNQLAALGLSERTQVVPGDALRILSGKPAGPRFDLVLLDPPYAELDLYTSALERLVDQAWLAPEAVIVVEYEKHRGARPAIRIPEALHCEAVREYGQTALEFLRLRSS